MIYGRFGVELTIERLAVLSDVKELDKRKPDKQDKEALANDAYVVVRFNDNGSLRLYHVAYLRADGGIKEINEALYAKHPELAAKWES